MTADAPELFCQVCGEALEGPLVWCRHCDTPHHADCWEFNGGCSTFGCGSKRARATPPSSQETVSHEPVVLTIEEDARDEPTDAVLVIDDGAPLPGGPRPAPPPPAFDPGHFAQEVASRVRRLPVTVARLACRVAEGLCWPGWAIAQTIYTSVDHDLRHPRGTSSFLGDLVLWLVGPRIFAVLQTLMYLLAVWFMACGALKNQSGPNPAVLFLHLGAYLFLAPLLKPLLTGLATLGLPAPAEPEPLPAVRSSLSFSRGKRRRRSRKRRHRH